jgi:Protein of unknown function (DUF1647)
MLPNDLIQSLIVCVDTQIRKMRQLCNVEYRAFDFTRYPPHVTNLMNYAWKPLIIHVRNV